MLTNADPEAYLSQSMLAIEAKRRELIAYGKADYMRDLRACLAYAMGEKTLILGGNSGESEPMLFNVSGSMENVEAARRLWPSNGRNRA